MTASAPLKSLSPYLPAAIVLVAWTVLANSDGGYFPTTWYPSAIGAVCLLLATALGFGRVLPEGRSARIALAALAALVVWSYVSMAWSRSPGTGWDSSNQLLLYLAVAWTLALLPWTEDSVRIALGAWVAATVLVCVISLVGAAWLGSLSDYFVKGRYLDPIGYSNGVSALPLLAFFPSFWLSSRAGAPLWNRAVFLGAAVFLAEFALLPQSRGAVIGFAVGLLAFVAIAPDRLRLIPPLLVVAGAIAVSVGPIYHVYTVGIELSEAAEAGRKVPGLELRPTLVDAAWAIAATSFVALLFGAFLGWLDDRVHIDAPTTRNLRRTVAGAIGLVVLAGVILGAANAGRISSDLSNRWDTFKSSKDTPPTTGARLTANYSDQRYDYWRVAYQQFESTPLIGSGAGSFESIYTERRNFDKPSKYTHDIWLRFMAEGGLVAALLLIGFLAAVGTGLTGRWRSVDRQGKGIVAVCSAVMIYFFVHGSFDWLEEFPALASPALALPFLGLVMTPDQSARRRPGVTASNGAVRAGACLLAAACIASLVFPYLADRHLARGAEIGLSDPAAARKELDRAASLNPLSPESDLLAGTILIAAHQPAAARPEFEAALAVENNWYAHFELALLAAEAGHRRLAAKELAEARSLDRHDPLLDLMLVKLRRGQHVDAARIDSEIRRIQAEHFTRPQA